jgi:hypothetical protein
MCFGCIPFCMAWIGLDWLAWIGLLGLAWLCCGLLGCGCVYAGLACLAVAVFMLAWLSVYYKSNYPNTL